MPPSRCTACTQVSRKKKELLGLVATYMPASFSCRHARYCPHKNSTPSSVAAIQYRLKAPRRPARSERRASSITPLEATSTAVLSHRMPGMGVLIQSFDSPRLTKNALLNAAKNMMLAASRTIRPVIEARRDAPRPPKPPSPPQTPWVEGGAPCPPIISVVVDPGML